MSGEWLSQLVSYKSSSYTAGLQEQMNELFKKLEMLVE